MEQTTKISAQVFICATNCYLYQQKIEDSICIHLLTKLLNTLFCLTHTCHTIKKIENYTQKIYIHNHQRLSSNFHLSYSAKDLKVPTFVFMTVNRIWSGHFGAFKKLELFVGKEICRKDIGCFLRENSIKLRKP